MLTSQPMPNRSVSMPNSSPHICFLERRGDGASLGEPLEIAGEDVALVAAQADRHVGAALERGRSLRGVGGHQGEAARVSSCACITRRRPDRCAPNSPNVDTARSPPKTVR